MTQQGRFASTSEDETIVYLEVHPTTSEEELKSIDFDNIGDILDFSADPCSSANFISKTQKQRLPQLRKMVTKDPVMLLELKPIIDKYADDNGQNSDNDEVDSEVDDEVNDEVDGKINFGKVETKKKRRRFRCFYCGDKFIRPTHLSRHVRIHTGEKPYYCGICRRRFSRSDYKLSHSYSHRNEKLHCCCVCGEVYFDLARFADHCCTHDDSEYIRIAMGKYSEIRQVQMVREPDVAATFAKQIELECCIKIVEVDNSTGEHSIVYIENPLYSSGYQTVSNNGLTSISGADSSICATS